MQIMLAIEVCEEEARKIANRTRQISDGYLSVTGFRRIDCHWKRFPATAGKLSRRQPWR